MKRITGNKWDGLLAEEWQKPYYQELRSFLIEEYKNGTVYPPAGDIYNALRLTDYDDVKAVILGQDPYHEPGQAHGALLQEGREAEPRRRVQEGPQAEPRE
jgi:uracil-DNA glycosylase